MSLVRPTLHKKPEISEKYILTDNEVENNQQSSEDTDADEEANVRKSQQLHVAETITVDNAADGNDIPGSDEEFDLLADPTINDSNPSPEDEEEIPTISYGNDEADQDGPGLVIPPPIFGNADLLHPTSKRAGGVSHNFQRLKIRSSKGTSNRRGRFGNRR